MADSQRPSGWAEHERAQRQAWLRLTARQRLDWLWEARAFVLRALVPRAEEARRRRGLAWGTAPEPPDEPVPEPPEAG